MKNTKKLLIIGACLTTLLSSTNVTFAKGIDDNKAYISYDFTVENENNNIFNEIDVDYSKINFIKKPWMLKSIYENDTEMQRYKYTYFRNYEAADDITSLTLNRSMNEIVKILKTPNGQTVKDIFGDFRSLKSYTNYIVITQDPERIGNENKDCVARLYYAEYEADNNGELKLTIKYIQLKASAEEIKKLPTVY